MFIIAVLLTLALLVAFVAGFVSGRSVLPGWLVSILTADYGSHVVSAHKPPPPAPVRPAAAAVAVPVVVPTPTPVPAPVSPVESVKTAAHEQRSSTSSNTSHNAQDKRYVIVAGSYPINDDAAGATTSANTTLAELRTKGFRDARIEKIDIPGKGMFLRVIAMEAQYPSINAAHRDVEAMKRRGDLTSAFAALARESR